ncbi:Crp/Fnr family transcriptional regulator [bacterium SCSIO 12741]|nr:Crp/Fnr family transcriptional regulator [bacterium SCSIO 12741]
MKFKFTPIRVLTPQEIEEEFRAFLSHFPFLQENEVDILVEHSVIKEFKKGTVLLREGSISKECYAVIRGCVREYYLKEGQDRSTAFFTEGQSVNSFSSYTNQLPSRHFLECSEDCLLTVGSQSLVDEMCARIPRLAELIQTEVEKDAGALQDRMASFMTSTPEERFTDLLESNPGLMNRVPQHQIASYLGVTPESLSRIKRRFFQKKDSA